MHHFSLVNRLIATTAVCGLILSIAPKASAAPIVADGDFASGLSPAWSVTNTSGTTPSQGPTVVTTNGSADSTGYGDIVPSNGQATQAVYFVADNATQAIYQTVSLTGGTQYALSFALFATQSGEGNANYFSLRSTVGDAVSSLVDATFENPAAVGDSTVPISTWTNESELFTVVTDGTYTLTFAFGSGATPAKDVLLDNVAINAVPEPISLALLGTGLLGLGFVRRLRTGA